MVVQHNIPAINSHRNLLVNNNATAKNLEKLSSGYRINRAGDDAAGLAISEKMRGQIRGLAKAEENAQNGISLIQTAEGGMQEIHSILQRMRELAVQSANGTYKDEVDRENLNLEFQSLKSEIDRISDYTNYNGIKLLNGELGMARSTGTTGTLASLAAGSVTTVALGTGYNLAANTVDTISLKLSYKEDGSLDLDKSTATIARDDGTSYDVLLSRSDVGSVGYNDTLTLSFNDGAAKTLTITATGNDGWDALRTDEVREVEATITVTNTGAAPAVGAVAAGTINTYTYDGDGLIFQIGANGTADQQVSLFVQNMASNVLGSYVLDPDTQTPWYTLGSDTVADQNIATRDNANAAIDVLDNAINMVSTQRAGLGALQNRLEYTLNNLGVTKENLTSAESVIRDVDMAKEMMEFTKNQILVQASQAMLATANQLPQGILNLLR